MAWNTGTSYTAASAWGATEANGVGLDFRTWGSNVDAASYNLSNLGVLTFHANGYVQSPLKLSTNESFTDLGATMPYYGLGYYGDPAGAEADFCVGLSGWGGLRFLTANALRMAITNTGSVGIGTATPTAKLQVVGLASYANNAAAIAAGKTAGAMYIVTGSDPAQVAIVV